MNDQKDLISVAVAPQAFGAFQMETIKELDNESTAQKSIMNKSKKRDRNAFMRQLPLGPSKDFQKNEIEPKHKRNYEENFDSDRNK